MSSAEPASDNQNEEAMQVVVLLVNARSNNALERVLGLLRRRAPDYAAMNVTTSEASEVAASPSCCAVPAPPPSTSPITCASWSMSAIAPS